MLQAKSLIPFMHRLLESGYRVMVETSGERPLAEVPKQIHKIVDVKCPASGEGGSFHLENLEALTAADEVKFVIADRADYEFAREFIARHRLAEKAGNILLSPAFRKNAVPERTSENCLLDPKQLVEWMLADGLPARLGLQIHKFIWAPQQKGV